MGRLLKLFAWPNFLWCPRHKDTPRHYECTRLITADHVIAVIATVPGFEADVKMTADGTSRKDP